MYHEKEGKTEKQRRTQLTTIVTEEVTVSFPVLGGFSVTGGSPIGGASSEPAWTIKISNQFLSLLYISMNSTRICAFWKGSCQRLPEDLSIEISIDDP